MERVGWPNGGLEAKALSPKVCPSSASDAIHASPAMTQQAQELATLKEMLSIFTNTQETLRRYRRNRLMVGAMAVGFILLALWGGSSGLLGMTETVLAAFFGGTSAGISFLYSCSVQQVPLFTRFTSPNLESIRDRIREIEKARTE